MKRLFHLGSAVAVAAMLLGTGLAFAQAAAPPAAGTGVTVPWGDWLGQVLSVVDAVLLPLLGAVLVWAAAFLPATLRSYVNAANIAAAEQLLGKAVDYGINYVEGATAGRTLSLDVRSSVLATAVQYAIDHGPVWLINWLGGKDKIEEKVLARLPAAPPPAVEAAASGAAGAPAAKAASG